MRHTRLGILLLGMAALLSTGSVFAVTREIAGVQRANIQTRQSVISQLTADIIKDPYDEFLRRPYNLANVNLERYPNLSPWPGQEGEQNRYIDFIIGNNGSSDVRAGADTLQGTYIQQSAEDFTWGVSAAYVSDDLRNADAVLGSAFDDREALTGVDARFSAGYRVSTRAVLGGGVSLYTANDEFADNGFTPGSGGFASLQEVSQQGFEGDFGFRWFTSEFTSWDAKFLIGNGTSERTDSSDVLDASGAVTSRTVVVNHDLSDLYYQFDAGYNRRFLQDTGEMQVRFGGRMSSRELNNSDLSYDESGGSVTPNLTLLGQDPVNTTEMFASFDTLFMRGWTQIFASGRVLVGRSEGSTQVDALGTIVNESIDDSHNQLGLVMGLRQPLWNERFRLVARARADWINQSTATIFDTAASGTETTQTTTAFAVGIETVLNNMVFDVAWLSGGGAAPAGPTGASRQTIDFDRFVVAATFGW